VCLPLFVFRLPCDRILEWITLFYIVNIFQIIIISSASNYAVCLDFSNAFALIPRNMLLHNLSSFGFSDAYVSWCRSYLTNRQPRVLFSGTFSLTFQVTSGVPQASVLGPLLFNILINDLCNSSKHCSFLNFADNLKIFRGINSIYDSLLVQSDIDSVSDANMFERIQQKFTTVSIVVSLIFLIVIFLS
jgi:hypothetical protein